MATALELKYKDTGSLERISKYILTAHHSLE